MDGLRERFGKYHVLERIAQGGMAEVYKVKTIGIAGFEKVQALKRILPHQAHQGRFIRSFIDEARIAVELNHRNIVQVFDFGKADGELYLAMELIEGKDLRSAMTQAQARRLRLPTTVASYIISEVAAGLDYAHRKSDGFGRALGIVHCDVSPSNVMLSTDGYVKILDFGIARASFASALERRRLRGKPRYMSPEQTRGEPPSPATDVFALAIIAWELYSGRALFTGNDLKEILGAVRRADVPRLDAINPEVPPEVVSTIATALIVAPEGRCTASDIATACGRAAAGAGARGLASWLGQLAAETGPGVSPWHEVDDEAPASISRSHSASRSQSVRSRPSGDIATATGGRPRGAADISSGAIALPRGAVPPPDDPVAEGTPGFDDPALDEPEETTRGAGGRWTIDTVAGLPRSAAVTIPGHALVPGTPPALPDDPAAAPAPGPEPDPSALWPEQTTVAGGAAAEWQEPVRDDPMEWDASALASLSGSSSADQHWQEATRAEPEPDTDAPPARIGDEIEAPPLADSGVGPIDDPIDDDVITSATPPAVVERRRIVVVVALVDAPELDTMRTISKSLGELAYQRGGVVLSLGERTVVVAFGLEVAGEDDVAIAMAWGLDATAMTRDAGGGATVRIGARTGVATPGGPDDRPRVGQDAIDEAMALARDAQPERPLFAGAAGRLSSSHYALREVTGRRGLTRRSRVLEVVGPRSFDERDRTLFSRRGRFVGRTALLTQLCDAFDLAVAADRRITALVTGPVGSGKSRLVAEVVGRVLSGRGGGAPRADARLDTLARAIGEASGAIRIPEAQTAQLPSRPVPVVAEGRPESRPMPVFNPDIIAPAASPTETGAAVAAGRPILITTTCGPASRLTPFAVVIDLYLSALGLPPARGRAARAQVVQRLLHVLTRAGTPLERVQATVKDLERAMELRDGLAVDAGELADLRGRIAAGVDDLRAVMRTAGRPGLVVLEDLHQADGTSLHVLRQTLDHPVAGGELLIMTARPEGPPLPPVDILIELDDLVGGELRELIVDRLGDAASPLNVAAVIARAGGNPLFVEDLAEAVRDSGDTLPATAREVIAARVDRLSSSAKAALKIAAVLGGAVRARLLEELVGVADLSAELHELCAEGFLVRTDAAAPDADEGELAFARGLVREVVYDATSQRAQRDAHARVGRLLASRWFAGRDEPPAVIAEHLERGGELAGAAAFWLRAGRLALSAFDAAAAAAHFTRTLELEARLGDPPPTAPSRTRRREARAGREEARRALGDLVTDAGDLEALVKLADGDPNRLADVELRVAQRHLLRGDLQAAQAAADRALEHADVGGPAGVRLRGEALRLRAESLERQARFEDALAAARSARVLFARLGNVVDETRAMIGQGRIHLARGQLDAARDLFKTVVTRIQRVADPVLERVVAIHVATIQLGLGSFADAMTSAQRAVELCRRHGDRAREGEALARVAVTHVAIGAYDDAATTFQSALDLLERTGAHAAYADCLVHAGLCDLRRGYPSGIEMIDEGARIAGAVGARPIAIHAQVARSHALLARGDVRAAADQAQTAATAARDVGLVGHEIVALARQARALADPPATTTAQGRLAADTARRALVLLEVHRYPAASIEEVLVSCAAALAIGGDRERAETLRERARQGVLRKLRELDPAWRDSYERIAENRALLR